MSRHTIGGGTGTVAQRLKADFQKPFWVTNKILDSNRFMYWSNHGCDLSANSLSFVGHDINSGLSWTPLPWFDIPINLSTVPTTLAVYKLAAQATWPLQSPYGTVRGSQSDSDGIVGPDYLFPGHDWMRKTKVAIAGAQGVSNTDDDGAGTYHRVLFAHHRFHWANYSRHPVKIVCVYQAHVDTTTAGSVINMLDDSISHPGPDMKRLQNVTILNVPGSFDNEGSKPGRSYYDIDFSAKEFSKDVYDKTPVLGTTDLDGLWRKLNVKYDTAFIDKIDANGVWENTTSPWETLSPDEEGGISEARVQFYARFDIPMANISMPAYTPKIEAAPAELTDAYKLLNMRVESRFLNEIRRTEVAAGYTGKDYRAVPTAV